MRIAKRRSKKLKKLEEEHAYLDNKVKQLTKDRLKDRSTESKDILSTWPWPLRLRPSLPIWFSSNASIQSYFHDFCLFFYLR